jgi:hypothetical protein
MGMADGKVPLHWGNSDLIISSNGKIAVSRAPIGTIQPIITYTTVNCPG